MKRLIPILALVFLTGCFRSGRITICQLDNFTPEKMTAIRDEARVVYDRGGSELSEGHIESAPVYEEEDDPSWASDVWTALVSILPDWNMRFTLLKAEWDVIDETCQE